MPPPDADWRALEKQLAALPRPHVVAWATRAAARIAPLIGRAEPAFGPEAWEWFAAATDALAIAADFSRGETISPFVLRVAAQLPRTVADAASLAARRVGPSPFTEPLELACAAAAFALDAALAPNPQRAAVLALQAGQAADATGLPADRLMQQDARELAAVAPADLGELWPLGEPDGWAELAEELARRRPLLPRFLAV